MAAEIPGAIHLTIPNAAHLSNLEAPEKFNAALGDFLKELP
jgi:pimeloyl-ACP methyl ester carboxylesterase